MISKTVSSHCFIICGSPCFAHWHEIHQLYHIRTSWWHLIKVDVQLIPRVALESCSHSRSKDSAIPRRNSGRIGNPRLPASRICLIRGFSSISVNLWPLVRVSSRGLIPASRVRRVDSGTWNMLAASKIDPAFFLFPCSNSHLHARFLDKGILNRNGGNITRWSWLGWIFGGCSEIRSSAVDYVSYSDWRNIPPTAFFFVISMLSIPGVTSMEYGY